MYLALLGFTAVAIFKYKFENFAPLIMQGQSEFKEYIDFIKASGMHFVKAVL